MTILSTSQRLRYSRAMLVPEIGQAGQQALLRAKVLVIGAGGLGSPLLLYLAASGIGTIGIVEYDTLEPSNLQRQILYTGDDINLPKSQAATARLQALNPDIIITAYPVKLDESNAAPLIRQYDIIADGSDNFATRLLVNRLCVRLRKPLVSAAVQGWLGQVITFKGYDSAQPCYECLVPHTMAGTDLSCDALGVVGPTVGIVGSLQAQEIIKLVAVPAQAITGELIRYNGLTNTLRRTTLSKDPACMCHEEAFTDGNIKKATSICQ